MRQSALHAGLYVDSTAKEVKVAKRSTMRPRFKSRFLSEKRSVPRTGIVPLQLGA